MLRMALIGSLILLNLSVWIGPAEVLAIRGKAILDNRPQHERAQKYLFNGDFESAVAEYEALIDVESGNVAFHTEYGMLWLNNGTSLQQSLGWSREKMLATVVEQFKLARDAAPGDFGLASQYAMALMDEAFFGTDLPVETVLEAWREVLAIAEGERGATSPHHNHYQAKAHTFLQLARTEYRYGRKAEMEKYIEQALAENPRLRIPRDLLEM